MNLFREPEDEDSNLIQYGDILVISSHESDTFLECVDDYEELKS